MSLKQFYTEETFNVEGHTHTRVRMRVLLKIIKKTDRLTI